MLRDEIAMCVVDYGCSNSASFETADAILALPSGLVAVRECPLCSHLKIKLGSCMECHDTGRIVRDLTVAEALEWAKNVVKTTPRSYLPNFFNSERIMRREHSDV